MIWRKFWPERPQEPLCSWRWTSMERTSEWKVFAAGSSRRTGVVSKIGFQYLIISVLYLMVYLFSHWNPYGTWSINYINRAIPHFETPPQRRLLRSDCWSSATTRAPKLGMAAVHMLSGWWMRWCRTVSAVSIVGWYLSGGMMCCFSWWAEPGCY